ncbi:MAG: uroporphyrinogen-III synthase [Paludibacter sp.]
MNTLTNKIIISTRPLIEDDQIKSHLTAKGAQVLDFPMIRTECVELSENIKTVFAGLNDFEWIVFTSKNGVICFYDLLKQVGVDESILSDRKIAVMGKATGDEVVKRGGNAHLISSGRTAEDLLVEIKREIQLTDKVLLALGELAEDKLETGLNGSCQTERINVYKTIDLEYTTNEIIDRIKDDKYDIILFTSPSGFGNFYKIMFANNIVTAFRIACIGTTTEKEMLKYNCQPLVVSPKSDVESFANAIEKYLASPNPSQGGEYEKV